MIEAIRKRKSIRSYGKKKLSESTQQHIIKVIDEVKVLKSPFGHTITLFFYDSPYVDEGQKIKIGTYGFIKSPKAFIAGKIENSFEGLMDYGFLFEHLILRLTEFGLGTVWLGGTFNRHDFKGLIEKGEIVPAITPVGYASKKASFREGIIRKRISADARIKFSELFFDHDFLHPLSEDHPYASYLNFVRIGPSASNKQPWRIIVENQMFHLYLKRTPKYGLNLRYDIQAIDMGIALRHLTIGLEEDQVPYTIKKLEHREIIEYVYITSILLNSM